MAFSFGFAGDDFDDLDHLEPDDAPPAEPRADAAFPVPGMPQLPATRLDLAQLLAGLPSKIAYSCLDVSSARIPRRELWDVRAQLMAEDDGLAGPDGLGDHDVKTGIYEGGFKSWESSVDLFEVLTAEVLVPSLRGCRLRVIELGCGTAIPSLALFQSALALEPEPEPSRTAWTFVLADYNPSVLQLVTLPNFLLTWALLYRRRHPALRDAFSLDGELLLTPALLQAFQAHLADRNISLFFLSGGWSPDFVRLLYNLPLPALNGCTPISSPASTLVLGAETIYSPYALQAFTETLLAILEHEETVMGANALAFVAAKRLYFGVGGSLDDFIEQMQARGARVTRLREETKGVSRGVVRCVMPGQSHEVPAQARLQ